MKINLLLYFNLFFALNNAFVLKMNTPLYQAAIDAKGIAMDSILAAHSGHMGLPLGCAEIGATLWGKQLQHFPKDSEWINRDRFVLSAGHGSMFLYTWLHLSGYKYLSKKQLQQFRQYGSMTPGHPESHFPGVESTTGPLGQGFANAVGMAVAQKFAASYFNTEEHKIFDNHIITLCGDGCIQEGISAEASAFAAHEGLDNLIVLYDSNNVTLDQMASYSQSETVSKRYEAYGWDVVTINGHNITQINKAIENSKNINNGRPKLIICKTIIGNGIQEIQGTSKAHGEFGVSFVEDAKKSFGLPVDERWFVSNSTTELFQNHNREILEPNYYSWQNMFQQWKIENPEKADMLSKTPLDINQWLFTIPTFDDTKSIATREAGSIILQYLAKHNPLYLTGSADLFSSCKNYIKNGEDFGFGPGKSYTGRNIHFGIREHAMGAIMNGIASFGLHRVSGSTFLVFSDYMRASIRVAALSNLPVTYIFTHDSIGVGEDGPTHQPVETVSALRCIPNLDVIRPADPEETVGAYLSSAVRQNGPTALILTRQNVPVLPIDAQSKRKGVLQGAYIAHEEKGPLTRIIMASGSEVQYAFEAVRELKDDGIRIVSMPCMEIFERQSQEYKEFVLPSWCKNRIAMEAGITGLWYKYVGLEGKVVGVDKFGFSAPAALLMKDFGINAQSLLG
jgi:transketolase